MARWPLGLRVGLLGGGQLARLLALAAHEMGLVPVVYCSSIDEPAAQVVSQLYLGPLRKNSQLSNFLNSVDVLTFESELIDLDILESLLPKKSLRPQIFPSLPNMRTLQNRFSQKKSLELFGLPTARFFEFSPSSKQDLTALLKTWQSRFPQGYVVKKSFGGYDGFGTAVISSPRDFKNQKLLQLLKSPCLIEEKILFQRELSLIAVASQTNIEFLPLVETHQKDQRCDWVQGPVQHRSLSSLKKKIGHYLKQIKYQGVIAFELFDSQEQLIINEVAPRVHNTGHHTTESLMFSQFHLHWMSGLGPSLPSPQLNAEKFAMINLVGESEGAWSIPADLSGRLHWYGKVQNRPGRKMGHLNYLGPKTKNLVRQGLKDRERIRK